MTDREDVKEAAGDFRAGTTVAVTGLVTFFIWQAIVSFGVLAGSEKVYFACVHAVGGPALSVNPSSFPTQIWCETDGDAYAGAVYSVWQSVGFSSVTVILVLVTLCGVWVMLRRDLRAYEQIRI